MPSCPSRRPPIHPALLVALVLPLAACSRADKTLPYPHESILSAVGELKIWLRSDPYREEPGRDLEGQNIFRATLARLGSIEGLTGPEYDDILAFARAECYERLGDWTQAAQQFESVAKAGTSLSEEAGIRLIWNKRFIQAAKAPPALENLADYLDYLDGRMVQFEQLRQSGPMFPYDSYIMIELEKALEEKAAFLFMNRVVVQDGSKRAFEAAEVLVKQHSASRRIGEHQLMLGGFSEALARDYIRMTPPDRSGSDLEKFIAMIDPAREIYSRVAERDGDPAKPEAQARLRSIEALTARTLQLAR